ncbi:MAG: hypothetical protein NTX75_10075 [Proteobacteria bacterium]|nr:hypothetical protein [Pseudomonadota bacterium]
MKKAGLIVFSMVLIVFAVNAYGQTSSALADEKFARVNKWLNQEKLSMTGTIPQAFVDNYIIMEGEGLPSKDAVTPGQKRLTATRAAEIVAYRNLAQFLDGVGIAGDATIKEMALNYEVVRVAVSGFVKGAQVIYKEYNEKDEVALVLVKVGMTGPGSVGEMVYKKVLGDPKIEKTVATTAKPLDIIKPVPVDERYDGIIIDATGYNFRPALINRVFTQKGEVLYDPSKVSQKILIEKGCGEYTNSVPKAQSALESRGVKNPLIIKAAGTTNPTDLQVSEDDAVKIFSANQKTGFLADAKVAFVLK